jgi:hypothetical protein
MNGHRRLLTRASILVALIAGHGTILLIGWSHTAMSAAVVSGVTVLVAIKHLGLLGPCTRCSDGALGKALSDGASLTSLVVQAPCAARQRDARWA